MRLKELSAKIGESTIGRQPCANWKRGLHRLTLEAVSVWEESRNKGTAEGEDLPQPMSQFSVFGSQTGTGLDAMAVSSAASNFSSFGKPILPTRNGVAVDSSLLRIPPSQPIPGPVLSDHGFPAPHPSAGSWRGGRQPALSATLLFLMTVRRQSRLRLLVLPAPGQNGTRWVSPLPLRHISKLTGLSVGQGQ